ncbi:DUF4192 domain-containing protein [Micromonospora sp. I033]
MSDFNQLPVGSPADLLTAVPYLLGFHPTDSFVTVGVAGTRVVVAGRADLPEPSHVAAWIAGMARSHVRLLRHAAATRVIVIGYGPATAVTPVMDAMTPRLTAAGLDVLDALRVTDGRYFSYLCQDPACCPTDGTPFDPHRSDVTMHAIVAGCRALPDRAALVASIAPPAGPPASPSPAPPPRPAPAAARCSPSHRPLTDLSCRCLVRPHPRPGRGTPTHGPASLFRPDPDAAAG